MQSAILAVQGRSGHGLHMPANAEGLATAETGFWSGLSLMLQTFGLTGRVGQSTLLVPEKAAP